jgi:dihydroorotate dehydrogenase electron transfer subunit
MKYRRACVQYVQWIHPEAFRLGLKGQGLAKDAVAGQFYMVRAGAGLDPFLPRPFALHRKFSPETAASLGAEVELLVQVAGKSTFLLSQKPPGDTVGVWGPLGRGWSMSEGCTAVLVGGGIGIASLLPLVEALSPVQRAAAQFFFGARTSDRLWCLDDLRRLNIALHTAVEQGNHRFVGTVLDLLQARWKDVQMQNPHLFICGPPGMVKAVALWALQQGIPGQVSLEAIMACGAGLCLGCAVKEREGEGYFHACRDGPIFNAADIDWSRYHE